MKKLLLFASCFFFTLVQAQTPFVSIDTIENYNTWGWKAIVMQNELITMATMPAIGARVMQYDLGGHPSLFLNSSEKGNTYTPAYNSNWYNFGGYKTWPAPQSAWNWPPPPTLDYGAYTMKDMVQTADSVSVTVTSPIEVWRAPNIQFERKATIYPGTSRVKMEQTMTNQGASAASWSMWSISQSIVKHTGQTDYSNFWVYFPINPNSQYGESGVYYQSGSTSAWKGEVAPGVYGVQFNPNGLKIFNDTHKGWIAYADRLDNFVYAKTFDIFEDAEYPDNGSRSSVYVSGSNPAYLEVEITGPIVELAGGGGSYTFTENWFAAKMRAPVLDVNPAGAIAEKMSYAQSTQELTGIYGAFYSGTAKVVFLGAERQILSQGVSHAVTPLAEFQLTETIAVPDGATFVEVRAYTTGDQYVGVIDPARVSDLITDIKTHAPAVVSEYTLEQNYPNPFNPSTTIAYSLPKRSSVEVMIYNMQGQKIRSFTFDAQPSGHYSIVWDGTNELGNPLSSGVHMYRLRAISLDDGTLFDRSSKMILLK